MIRVNLLYSLHDRPAGTISAPSGGALGAKFDRLTISAVAITALTLALIGWDVISSQMAVTTAQQNLAEQQRVETELAAILKEQKELEQKIQSVEARIDAIKRLRTTQAGPSSVLEAISERIANTPGIFLESIAQKGGELEIKGTSPSDEAITQFGRSLEFSSGLFSNLSIETQRKEIAPTNVSMDSTASAEAPKQEEVSFTIKTSYTPGKGSGNSAMSTAVQQAPAASSGARPVPPPPQLAQNN